MQYDTLQYIRHDMRHNINNKVSQFHTTAQCRSLWHSTEPTLEPLVPSVTVPQGFVSLEDYDPLEYNPLLQNINKPQFFKVKSIFL